MSEKVNHPDHYNTESFECIDVMGEVFGTEAVKNFCKLNAFKYLWRADEKDGMNDIRKAQWYLEHMLSLDTEDESDEDEQENDEIEDVTEHLCDAFRNLYETISNGIKEVLEMYAETTDPESETSKRLRYFQRCKRLGRDDDFSFILALETDLKEIEERLKDEEEKDEQQDQKSGEK